MRVWVTPLWMPGSYLESKKEPRLMLTPLPLGGSGGSWKRPIFLSCGLQEAVVRDRHPTKDQTLSFVCIMAVPQAKKKDLNIFINHPPNIKSHVASYATEQLYVFNPGGAEKRRPQPSLLRK